MLTVEESMHRLTLLSVQVAASENQNILRLAESHISEQGPWCTGNMSCAQVQKEWQVKEAIAKEQGLGLNQL